MRDYLTIPCYLYGTQGFTAQRMSCTPEEQDLCADMGSTASAGGERGSQGIKKAQTIQNTARLQVMDLALLRADSSAILQGDFLLL